MNIYEKIQSCRVKLQDMKLKKTGENKYAGFKYFELGDFLPSVNKLFLEAKLFSKFILTKEKAILTIIDTEDDNAQAVIFETPTAHADKIGTAIQALGAEHTYLRRYLYLNALEIVENDEFDALDNTKKTVNNKPQKERPAARSDKEAISDDDIEVYAVIDTLDDVEQLKEYYKQACNLVKNAKDFNQAVNKRIYELKKQKNGV